MATRHRSRKTKIHIQTAQWRTDAGSGGFGVGVTELCAFLFCVGKQVFRFDLYSSPRRRWKWQSNNNEKATSIPAKKHCKAPDHVKSNR